MKIPLLKRDATAELAKTTAAISEAASKLAGLREERARVLTEADDFKVIKRIDYSIADCERFIASLQERLSALDALRRKQREATRLEEKGKAVAAFEREYRAKRVDAAADVIEAAGKLGDTWIHYKKVHNEPWHLWRDDLFPSLTDRYSPFTPVDHLLDRIANVLGMQPEGAETRLTEVRNRTAEITKGLTESADSYLTALRDSPLPRWIEPEEAA
jgi:hypothetical protein